MRLNLVQLVKLPINNSITINNKLSFIKNSKKDQLYKISKGQYKLNNVKKR